MAVTLPALGALSACARDAAERGEAFTTLTPDEARAISAFAARIFPTDDAPGAEEAGVVYFVDRGLGQYFGDMLEPIRSGLRDLDERARSLDAGTQAFADLSPERQAEVLRQVEQGPFFSMARMLVVAGMFSDPRHGGNRDGVGWQLIGIDHRGSYQPPFGHYDAEYAREQAGGAA